MKLIFVAIVFALVSLTCQARIGDENEIGLYAIDCANPDKGAISIDALHVILAANGRTLELARPNDDQTSDYFGRTEPPKSFIKVISAEIDNDRIIDFEVFKDKKGYYVQTSTGHDAITMKISPVFFSGNSKFRKCK